MSKENTAMQIAIERQKEMLEVLYAYRRQPDNRSGTTNFDICTAEIEISRRILQICEGLLPEEEQKKAEDAIEFSYWLMTECELEEDNSLWSYESEDYSNERLYEIWYELKYGTDGK
jgi:hypothetical protein